ncbi:MAG: hypothetical protein M0Z94_10355 [Dehalococcoidales bacterium]|nr:hypothetical protein [Dehalococcoidales bacterium]
MVETFALAAQQGRDPPATIPPVLVGESNYLLAYPRLLSFGVPPQLIVTSWSVERYHNYPAICPFRHPTLDHLGHDLTLLPY